MPDTRRSSLSKKSIDASEDEKTGNPKLLLKNFVELNETVPASQPDDSPTVTNIKQKVKRRSSRRSSGIRALTQTPHVLLKNFFENAPEETPVFVNSSDETSAQSDAYIAPIPRKISKVVDDDQNESSVFEEETDDVVRKMPRTRHKAVLQKFSENLKQQSESLGEESGSETKQQTAKMKKIRNKITAEDIASGIKLLQEKAAETERSSTVTQATKTETSLGYLSVNTLNAENLDETTTAVAETSEKSDFLVKKDDSASPKLEKSLKRKRSSIKEGSSKEEPFLDPSDEEGETLQKSKMSRIQTDTAEFVSHESSKIAETVKTDVPDFVSEIELTDVAYIVEVAESVEVAENGKEANKEESESHKTDNKEIVQKLEKNERHETKETATQEEDSIQSKLNEINQLLQDESTNTVKTMYKDSAKKAVEAIVDTSDTKRTNSPIMTIESTEQVGVNNSQTVSNTDNEILSKTEIEMETDENTDAHSKNVKSNLEGVETVSSSPRGDDSNVSKRSGSKEYLAESIDSSVEALTQTSEVKKFTEEKNTDLLDSKVEQTLASGDPPISDVDLETSGVDKSNLGAVSGGQLNSSVISHESSPIVSEMSEAPVQSNETKSKEKEQSEELPMLTVQKGEERKNKKFGSLTGERVSTDEQDELFPSSPKETTSSGHSRSSSPASSEVDKVTRRLTLPSSSSAFVEMKSTRPIVQSPSTSGVLAKRMSSVKKTSKKEKSSEQQENKSYRVIDSVVSPTESVPYIEASYMTKDGQVLSQSPYGTMKPLQHTMEIPVGSEPQEGPSEISERARRSLGKNKINNRLKKYTIPPKVTSLLINHYSGLKIPPACLPELGKISDRFFDNLFEALNCYANHASRRRIEASDAEMYFKRIGLVNKNKSINTLIRDYLPLEDQQLLIPVARSGNVITGGFSNKKKKN